jgi:hypothetical protein
MLSSRTNKQQSASPGDRGIVQRATREGSHPHKQRILSEQKFFAGA